MVAPQLALAVAEVVAAGWLVKLVVVAVGCVGSGQVEVT